MSPVIILDADFLSAFLKIQRLDLVKDFYDVEIPRVPVAVYREISLTNLLPSLTALPWIQLAIPEQGDDAGVLVPDFVGLGKGEQEAIRLARETQGSLLLMNDLKARRIAHQLEVETVDIPAFLLSCKLVGFLGSAEIRAVVQALQEKDRYGFRKEVLARLLS